ncbi:MAG: alpha/beta fold hydrolase [Rhodospirillaceae bacterium]
MKPRRGYADGPTGQIHFRSFGNGIPLVLSHQSPSSSNMFRKVYPILAEAGILAIGIDTPGFGNSDVPDPRPSLLDYASAFGPVLDHFGLSSAIFLGHHTGAANVTVFADQYPDRVDKLILNGPPVFSIEERESRLNIPRPAPIQSDGSHLIKRWAARMEATVGWTDLDAMHNNVLQTLWAGETFWYGHKAAYEYDITNAFMGLRMPTLILTNTGDDIYHLSCRARAMRPDMSFLELEGGTHDIVDEQPRAWSQAVISFIKDL